jgi:hypothetical protein
VVKARGIDFDSCSQSLRLGFIDIQQHLNYSLHQAVHTPRTSHSLLNRSTSPLQPSPDNHCICSASTLKAHRLKAVASTPLRTVTPHAHRSPQ